MNQHPDLETLISRETSSPNPRQKARQLLDGAGQGTTHAVLYSDRNRRHWQVVFIPCEGIPSLGQAARKYIDGLPAIATAPVSRPLP